MYVYLSLSLSLSLYIYICIKSPPWINKPPVNKVPGPPKINKRKTTIPDNPNSEK